MHILEILFLFGVSIQCFFIRYAKIRIKACGWKHSYLQVVTIKILTFKPMICLIELIVAVVETTLSDKLSTACSILTTYTNYLC